MIVRGFGSHAFSRIMGMMMPVVFISIAFSPVIAGWIRDKSGSYAYAFMYCAGLLVLSCLAILTVKTPRSAPLDTPAVSGVHGPG